MANINHFFHFLLLILCTGFLHYIDSELINNKPLRLKRSTIPNRRSQGKYQPTQQQKEPIHHEEDEQTILDEQEQDVISLNNGTHGLASNGVTMNDCGISLYATKDVERIVGGQPAMPGQFPWQVYLRIVTSGGDMLCGGSILNPNWILTAAHCISNEQSGMYMANQIEVIAGSLDRFSYGSDRQSRYADCALKHPKWTGVSGGFANDIALIRLPQYDPLDLNGYNVRGVCLPPKRYPPFDYNGVARVAGWGLTRDRGSPSRTLQYTDVNMITDNQCRRYQYPVNIINSMACQGVDHSSPCQGDSGGPLVIRNSDRYVQFGLVSFGPGICNNGRIPNAVYTQVSYHMNWIENTIRSYMDDPRCQPRRINFG